MNPRLLPFLLPVALTLTAQAQSLPAESENVEPGTRVERALVFLALEQKTDGSFEGLGPNRVEATSWATLAFLSAGRPPGEGRFGRVISRAGDYLVSQSTAELTSTEAASALLALSQSMAVESSPDRAAKIRGVVERLASLLLRQQDSLSGGWLEKGQLDVRVTARALIALRAVRLAGIRIPTGAMTKGADFIVSCRTVSGAFSAAPMGGDSIPATAEGVLALVLTGGTAKSETPRPEIAPALDVLSASSARPNGTNPLSTHLATALLLPLVEAPQRDLLRARLLAPRLGSDGSISLADSSDKEKVHSTSVAILSLTAHWGILPAFRSEK